MYTRFLNSRYAALAPLIPVLLLVIAYIHSQWLFIECNGGHCQRATIAPLFEPDASMAVDSNGALDTSGLARVKPDAKDTTQAGLAKKKAEARERMLKGVVRRHSARFVWSFFVALGVLVSIAGWVAAALLLTRSPGERGWPYVVRAAMAFVPGLALGVWMYGRPDVQMNLMWGVLNGTIGAPGSLRDTLAPGTMKLVNSVELATSLALILACAIMLLPSRRVAVKEVGGAGPEERLRQRLLPVTHRLRNLRIFLYVATLLLVVGVLRMQAVMDWVLSFVSPEDAAVLSGLTGVLSSVMGAFYSLVLAALYLPSAYVLRERAEAVIADARVPDEVAEKIRKGALPSTSLNTAVPRIAALLGPLLAGPFANLLTRL